jgi:hypothetical protein
VATVWYPCDVCCAYWHCHQDTVFHTCLHKTVITQKFQIQVAEKVLFGHCLILVRYHDVCYVSCTSGQFI